jgi:hypothetical protein
VDGRGESSAEESALGEVMGVPLWQLEEGDSKCQEPELSRFMP